MHDNDRYGSDILENNNSHTAHNAHCGTYVHPLLIGNSVDFQNIRKVCSEVVGRLAARASISRVSTARASAVVGIRKQHNVKLQNK